LRLFNLTARQGFHAKAQRRKGKRKENEMTTEAKRYTENEIATVVVDAAIKIHKALGPGLLESVYEAVLAYELESRGLKIARQAPLAVIYESVKLDQGFRIDIVVEGLVVLEIKSVEVIAPVHKKQVLTYLRLANLRLGLLLNFGEAYMRDGITRVANGMPA
jgi:GxxExxY protein